MKKANSDSAIGRLRRSAIDLLGRLRPNGSERASTVIEAPVDSVAEQGMQEQPPGESFGAQEVLTPTAVRDTFCVLAWNHLQIAPNGTVKMCCIAGEDLQEKGRPMSLYTDSYEEIWNSGYMRDARRGMADGEMISPCMRCYREEDSVGQSRRTIQNATWLAKTGRTREDFIQQARDNSWMVRDRPSFLQLNLGNLCNLACRMCSSQYSSRIEADSVHNKWMPASYPDVAHWRGKKLTFGPRPFFGVNYSGFYAYECSGDYALRWSNGAGVISFEIPSGTKVSRLGLSLRTIGGTNAVAIRLNGLEIFSGQIGPNWTQEFESPVIASRPTLDLEIESVPEDVGGRQLGVALLDAWIERHQQGSSQSCNDRGLTRLSANQPWWGGEEVMFGEILGQPETLEYIIFQGGEPFLVKEFDRILDLLIERGVAANVTFEIVSNLTTLKDSTIAKLAQLKKVLLEVSIDGIADVLEYIRYPAKWPEIQANIARVVALPNLRLSFTTAVQIYNLHHMPDILRYCDAHDMDGHTHFLVGPRHLNVLVLPPAARQAALEQLHDYLAGESVRPANRGYAEYMITFLTQHAGTHYQDEFDNFVHFTNDLDMSRGQSFRESFPRLVEWFSEASQVWTDETRYARQLVPASAVRTLSD
jgi:MoaA/NifB/PqqE/SkfB family radical SAM enzyme